MSIAVFFTACKESKDSIIIPSENPFEVMPIRFQQNILLEHFSDEALEATVNNSLLIDRLQLDYPHRIIVANFHRNDDWETSYTNYIANTLGGLISIDKGSVNRQLGKSSYGVDAGLALVSSSHWEASIFGVLQSPEAPLSIGLTSGSNIEGQGNVSIYIAHKKAILGDTRLMVYLVEDNIQPKFQAGSIENFKHNNVLKNLLTSFDGDSIDLTSESSNGEIKKIVFPEFDLKNYDVANLKVIAFVYSNGVDYRNKQILNVQEAHFYGAHYWDVN